MAASYVTAARATLRGLYPVSGRWLRLPASCQCSRLQTSLRPLHVCSASLSSSMSEPPQKTSKQTDVRREKEIDFADLEYVPTKKAKNPMIPIGYAWLIGLPTGILTFLLAKRQVDKNRLKQLKIRQRMSMSNEGECEGNRYHHHRQSTTVDQ